jgi:hypothetical protein
MISLEAKQPLFHFEIELPDNCSPADDNSIDFHDGITSLPCRLLLIGACSIVNSAFSLIPSLIGRPLIDSSALAYLNLIGDFELQAIFGIYDSY